MDWNEYFVKKLCIGCCYGNCSWHENYLYFLVNFELRFVKPRGSGDIRDLNFNSENKSETKSSIDNWCIPKIRNFLPKFFF